MVHWSSFCKARQGDFYLFSPFYKQFVRKLTSTLSFAMPWEQEQPHAVFDPPSRDVFGISCQSSQGGLSVKPCEIFFSNLEHMFTYVVALFQLYMAQLESVRWFSHYSWVRPQRGRCHQGVCTSITCERITTTRVQTSGRCNSGFDYCVGCCSFYSSTDLEPRLSRHQIKYQVLFLVENIHVEVIVGKRAFNFPPSLAYAVSLWASGAW